MMLPGERRRHHYFFISSLSFFISLLSSLKRAPERHRSGWIAAAGRTISLSYSSALPKWLLIAKDYASKGLETKSTPHFDAHYVKVVVIGPHRDSQACCQYGQGGVK